MAQLADLEQEVESKLWWLIALVLGTTGLYLVAAFRSLLLPLKALAMNALSVAAAFGLLTLIHGGARSDPTTVLNFYIPVTTFVVLFALSTDYEVFLIRRIQEHHRAHGDTTAAVIAGIRDTARPITLAALVMVTVFAGLLTADRIEVHQVGLALALAITIDATVIRLVLVPALIGLFGRYNWWLPKPLATLLRTTTTPHQPKPIASTSETTPPIAVGDDRTPR